MKLGLRSYLLLLALFSIVPATILMWVNYREQREAAVVKVNAEALHVAKLAALQHEEAVRDARLLLGALATSSRLDSSDPGACSSYLAEVRGRYPRYANLGFITSAGAVVCSAVPLQQPFDASQRPLFQKAFHSRGFVVGGHQISPIVGVPVLASALPVRTAAGSLRGIVYASLDLRWLHQQAFSAGLSGDTTSILDTRGTLLYRQPDSERWIGRSVRDAPIVQWILRRQQRGTVETKDVDGVRRLHAFVPLNVEGQPPAFFIVGFSSEGVFAPAKEALGRNLLVLVLAGLLVLASLLIAWELLITRNFRRLVFAAQQLGARGVHFPGRTARGPRELRELGAAFDRMAEEVQARQREREQAERALQESHQRLLTVVNAANIGLWEWNIRTNAVHFSPEWKRQLGYNADEIPNRYEEWETRMHPEDLERALAAVQQYVKHPGGSFEEEFRLRHKDGSYRRIFTHARLVKFPDGEEKFVGCHVDLTDRKAAEQARQASEQRYRMLFTNCAALLCTHDLEGKVLSLNATAAAAFGYSEEALVGRNLKEALVPTARQFFEGYLDRIRRNGKDAGVMHVAGRGGVRIWLYRNVLCEEPGRDPYVIGSALDITQQHHAEAERARLAEILDATPDLVAMMDSAGRGVYINRGGRRMLGLDPEEPAAALLAPKYAPWAYERVVNEGLPTATRDGWWSGESALLGQDGAEIPVSEVILTHRRADGSVKFISSICRDISEQKRAEQENRTLASLVENSSDFIGVAEMDGRVVYVNPAGLKLIGNGDGLFRSVRDYFEDKEARRIAEEILPVLRTSGRWSGETTLQNLNTGARIPVEVTGFVIRDPASGEPARMGAIIRDISERKAAEQAIQESEERFRQMAEASPIGFTLGDLAERRVLYISPAMEAITGYPAADLTQRIDLWTEIKHPEHRPHVVRHFHEHNWEKVFESEHRIIRRDGAVRWIREKFSAVPDGEGVRRVAGIVEDITERRQAEEALREHAERLQELTTYLERVREEERTRIAREIHDELGQSLTAIRMELDALGGKLETAPAPQLRARLEGTVGVVDSTIRAVRKIASELRPAVLDLSLAAAIEWQAQQFQSHSGIACQLDLTARDVPLDGEQATGIFRIVQEALTNVARHSEATAVLITLAVDGGAFTLEVADNGQGFNGPARKGSLGMLGMRERALLLGGELTIEGVPGRGTVVRAHFPVGAAGKAAPA